MSHTSQSIGNKRGLSEWSESHHDHLIEKQSKKSKRGDFNVFSFRHCIQWCCKFNDFTTAADAYNEAVEKNIRIEAKTFYALLNLCDGLSEKRIHIGTPSSPKDSIREESSTPKRAVALSDRVNFAERIKRHMDELKIPLVENAYTALVKLYARSGRTDEAESLVDEAESVQQCCPKLRMYAPLMKAHCDNGRMVPALRIWERITRNAIRLSEREYKDLIKCSTIVGDVSVMEKALSELAEDILVPSSETCQAIKLWFSSEGSRLQSGKTTSLDEESSAILDKITTAESYDIANMGPVVTANAGWQISDICEVTNSTGRLASGCLRNEMLQPVSLARNAWDEMLRMNDTIVTTGQLKEHHSKYQGGQKGMKRKLNPEILRTRQVHWEKFKKYIENRNKREQIDFVLDGANIGYYKTNFKGAAKHVDYYQVNAVIEHLRGLSKSVLLIMHSRHFGENLMPSKFKPLVNRWLDDNILYQTPPGMDDDWFWMHAALLSGPGTHVVTNDLMRDHHFQMMARRSFIRWRERHQVRFTFLEWDTSTGHRRVGLEFPEKYSRRIQRVADGLVVPHVRAGDDNRFMDGTRIAGEDAPTIGTYFCVRPRYT